MNETGTTCVSSCLGKSHSDVFITAKNLYYSFDIAKAIFAIGADGWLVAYVRVHGSTDVTNE